MSDPLALFGLPWRDAPTCFIDVETTGLVPGIDTVCQLGMARFEKGELVSQEVWLCDPGCFIPAEATAIHGITDDMVKGEPTLADLFKNDPRVKRLIDGTQPAAFNAVHDRLFMPPGEFDTSWPWLDCMIAARVHDGKACRGKGNGTLSACCLRNGIELTKAHDAGADAAAAGKLLYKIVGYGDLSDLRNAALGNVLLRLEMERARDFFGFMNFLWRKKYGGG